MNRIHRMLGMGVGLLLLAPLSAHALGISVVSTTTSSGTSTLQPGDTVTYGLVLENGTNENLFGLGVAAAGYDANQNGESDDALAFASATVVDSAFDTQFVGGPFGSTGGLSNALVGGQGVEAGGFDPLTFVRDELRVLLFNGVSFTGTSADGSNDAGVAGDEVSQGDVHFLVTFVAAPSSPETTTANLVFGAFPELDTAAIGQGGVQIPFNNAQAGPLTIIPEPGTALLMGLGLSGLAMARRR